jgi:hypothetical protein
VLRANRIVTKLTDRQVTHFQSEIFILRICIDTTGHFFLYFFQDQWVIIRNLFEKRGWKRDEFGWDESTFVEI